MAAGQRGSKQFVAGVLVAATVGCPVCGWAKEVTGAPEVADVIEYTGAADATEVSDVTGAAPKAAVIAQPSDSPPSPEALRWAMTLSAHAYREAQMRLVGPTLGLRAEGVTRVGDWPLNVEGEISAGLASYSSPVSGRIDGVKRIGSMLHLSSSVADQRTWVPRPGLGLSTEWTDLRAGSVTGDGGDRRYFSGYERFNASLWLSASWDLDRERPEGAVRLRAALLVAGWQRSMLSQAVAGYADVTNRQRRGALLSVERPVRFDDVEASLRAGIRIVGRSDIRPANHWVAVYEPANQTFEIAMTLWR